MNALIEFLKLKLMQLKAWWGANLAFPMWYLYLALILLLFSPTLPYWIGPLYFFIGCIIVAYEYQNS